MSRHCLVPTLLLLSASFASVSCETKTAFSQDVPLKDEKILQQIQNDTERIETDRGMVVKGQWPAWTLTKSYVNRARTYYFAEQFDSSLKDLKEAERLLRSAGETDRDAGDRLMTEGEIHLFRGMVLRDQELKQKNQLDKSQTQVSIASFEKAASAFRSALKQPKMQHVETLLGWSLKQKAELAFQHGADAAEIQNDIREALVIFAAWSKKDGYEFYAEDVQVLQRLKSKVDTTTSPSAGSKGTSPSTQTSSPILSVPTAPGPGEALSRKLEAIALKVPTTAGASSKQPEVPRFELTLLSDETGLNTYPRRVTDSGAVLGMADRFFGTMMPVIWKFGQQQEFNNDLKLVSTIADLNEHGQFVDNRFQDGRSVVLFHDGTGIRKMDFSAVSAMNIVQGINNKGELVGVSLIDQKLQSWILRDGYVDLIPSNGAVSLDASLINDQGIVAGQIQEKPDSPTRAFVYVAKKTKVLGTLGTGKDGVLDLSESTDVVGYSTNQEGFRRAVLWTDDKPVELSYASTDIVGNESEAFGINDKSWIVGWAGNSKGRRTGVLWVNQQPHNLNALVLNANGWHIRIAADVNNLGWIAATGRKDDRDRAVILKPIAQ